MGRYIEGYELAKQYDLKFICGTETYIVKDRFEKDKTNAHLILLAKNENGRKSLNRILSEANITGFYYRARIDFDLLFSLPKDDVWLTSACLGGLWKYGEEADDLILKVSNYFGNNFFLEVQNHNTESQATLNKHIIDMSNHYNIPIIFG
jgi:DNA polymerase III alpha subunit